MKNLKFKENNNQEIKFRKQVSHLSGFIGMPTWNGRNPTLSEIREYDRRVSEMQALGLGSKKRSLLSELKTIALSIFRQIRNVGKKTKTLKHELTNPINSSSECCG